jgi:hypothetical protein
MLDWFAHLIQRTGIKMKVVPVIKAGQGAGKGIIISLFIKSIIGVSSYVHVSDVDTVLAGFQDDSAKTSLLTFLDEATFSGDKKQASKLKALITEATKRFEQKFVNAIFLSNLSNYFIASNYDHIVHVEHDDRRYWCFEADNKYTGKQTTESKAYFDRLSSCPPEAFAKFLYERDISQFNPCAYPSTDYLLEQKLLNFDSVQTFIEHILRFKELPNVCISVFQIDSSKQEPQKTGIIDVDKSKFYQAYLAFTRTTANRRVEVESAVMKRILRIVGDKGLTVSRPVVDTKRCRQWHINIEEARKGFCAYTKEPNWFEESDTQDASIS